MIEQKEILDDENGSVLTDDDKLLVNCEMEY